MKTDKKFQTAMNKEPATTETYVIIWPTITGDSNLVARSIRRKTAVMAVKEANGICQSRQ